MYIDVCVETWAKGKGIHLFYLYTSDAADIDSPEIDSYGIWGDLINSKMVFGKIRNSGLLMVLGEA